MSSLKTVLAVFAAASLCACTVSERVKAAIEAIAKAEGRHDQL